VTSTTLRKPDILPPKEIDEAILKTIDENFGAGRDELTLAISRAFGFASTSAQLRSTIEKRIDALLVAEKLMAKEELLVRNSEKDTYAEEGQSL
jgi:hypothetical protein